MLRDAKANPTAIIKAHYRSYRKAGSRSARWQDWVAFTTPPIVVGAVVLYRDIELGANPSIALITACGLLTGLFFGVMLLISERAMTWGDEQPIPDKAITAHARFLQEISANAGYATLVSIACALVLVVATVTGPGWGLRIATAIAIALAVHLILVLLMVMKRVYALTEQRLTWSSPGRARKSDSAREAAPREAVE